MFKFRKDIQNLSDEQLMDMMTSRQSHTALTELHARYSKKVLGFFIRMLNGDTDKAQDFTQDLFLKILEKHLLFDSEKRFNTWMYTIASNMCKTEYRKIQNVRIEQIPLSNVTMSICDENQIDKVHFNKQLKISIAQLEEHHRIAFILRYMEELSIKEIAVITASAEGTVKSRLFYGTKKITEFLTEFNPQNQNELFKLG